MLNLRVVIVLSFIGLVAAGSPASAERRCYFGVCDDGGTTSNASQELPEQNYADELTNFGIAPQNFMQASVSGPTPMTVPGASTLTTKQIVTLIQRRENIALIDVLGGPGHATLPGAVRLPYAGEAGNFEDRNQTALLGALGRITRNRLDYPLVFFCQGARCWESYNAVLRARAIGFTNLYWYRGGIAAWQAAQLPFDPNQ